MSGIAPSPSKYENRESAKRHMSRIREGRVGWPNSTRDPGDRGHHSRIFQLPSTKRAFSVRSISYEDITSTPSRGEEVAGALEAMWPTGLCVFAVPGAEHAARRRAKHSPRTDKYRRPFEDSRSRPTPKPSALPADCGARGTTYADLTASANRLSLSTSRPPARDLALCRSRLTTSAADSPENASTSSRRLSR